MATTMLAASHSSVTHSIIGRSANMSIRPEPSGPWMTVPSSTKMSSGLSPLTQSVKIFLALVAQLHAQRRVPEDLQPEVDDQVDDVGLLGVEERHGVAGTGSRLEPQH